MRPVDPNTDFPDDGRREVTVPANGFFSGHDSKLIADVSRLTVKQPDADTHFPLQWDVSF